MTAITFPPSVAMRLPADKSLASGIRLSILYGMPINPADVARVLRNAKVRYVLVGAHAINLYTGRPRATQDVDILTSAPLKARRAVEKAYPALLAENHPVVIRFTLDGAEVLDLIKSTSVGLFRQVLRHVTTVSLDGEGVVVPAAEAAIALKFYSMVSPTRSADDRMQDAVDFSRAAKLQRTLDAKLLAEFGELVYAGGGAAILRLIDDARAGRRLEI